MPIPGIEPGTFEIALTYELFINTYGQTNVPAYYKWLGLESKIDLQIVVRSATLLSIFVLHKRPIHLRFAHSFCTSAHSICTLDLRALNLRITISVLLVSYFSILVSISVTPPVPVPVPVPFHSLANKQIKK